MSMVADLREALQDVIAPDLKAVVRGLNDLKEEVRNSNALLREEMQSSNVLMRREIEQSREEARANTTLLREDMRQQIVLLREDTQRQTAILREDTQQHLALLREEARASEARSAERFERLHEAIKLAMVTRRLVDAEKELDQLRSIQQLQQPQQ